MKRERCCERCAAFEPFDDVEAGDPDGECRLHPPKHCGTVDKDTGRITFLWPDVDKDEWCMDFISRELLERDGMV